MNKKLKWILLFFLPVIILMPLSLWLETTQNYIVGIVFWILLIPAVIWELFCMYKLLTELIRSLKR